MKKIICICCLLTFLVSGSFFITNFFASILHDSFDEKQIELDNGTIITVTENYSNVNGQIQKAGTLCVVKIELTDDGELIIPTYVDNMPITRIRADGLENPQNLKRISLPDTLEEIDSFFSLCTNLETIDIGKSIATVNYGIFMHCSKLHTVNVSPENERYVFQNGCLIDRATNCLVLGLAEFVIPDNIECIGDYAFLGRIDADELFLPDGLKSIGGSAFESCDIDEIHIPNSVETIENGAFAFSSIKRIVLPNELQNVSSDLFWCCNSLEEVYIGENVMHIDELAFAWCPNLATIIVSPDNQNYYSDQNCLIEKTTNRLVLCGNEATLSSKIHIIGRGSLSEACTLGNQSHVFIPNNVREIETLAICGDTGDLQAVYIPKSVEKMADCAIILTGEKDKNLVVYCEATSKPDGWDDNWLGNANDTEVVWGAEMPNWQ